MKTIKTKNGQPQNFPEPKVNGIRIHEDPRPNTKSNLFLLSKEETDRKEIIRRLRIQNKKLMERVDFLNDQVKRLRLGQIEMKKYQARLMKIERNLSRTLEAAPLSAKG